MWGSLCACSCPPSIFSLHVLPPRNTPYTRRGTRARYCRALTANNWPREPQNVPSCAQFDNRSFFSARCQLLTEATTSTRESKNRQTTCLPLQERRTRNENSNNPPSTIKYPAEAHASWDTSTYLFTTHTRSHERRSKSLDRARQATRVRPRARATVRGVHAIHTSVRAQRVHQ